MSRFQRSRDAGERQRATALELFFDLVFVFAITQVSHLLLDDLSWNGAGQALLALLVVWWAWNYTTWVTNELDPDSIAVRLLLIGLMLGSLLMAVAIPQAFGAHGLLFAGSYVAIQVGRHMFLTFVAAEPGTIERERAARILTWFVAAGVLWIAGGLADDDLRWALWLAALAVDYAAPLVLYWVPGRPRLASSTWEVETAHFAERFQLFVIIALGETIVLTGSTTAGLDLDTARIVAFGLAFLGTAALWWLYFDYVARIAERRLELAEDRTKLARDAFTYLHAAIVGGVVLSAVGDELVIAHPTDVLPGEEVAVVVAGPALYLLAHVALRLRMTGTISVKRLTGALACMAVGGIGVFAPALVVGALLVAVLVAVIASEQLAAARRRARGELSPLERLEPATAGNRFERKRGIVEERWRPESRGEAHATVRTECSGSGGSRRRSLGRHGERRRHAERSRPEGGPQRRSGSATSERGRLECPWHLRRDVGAQGRGRNRCLAPHIRRPVGQGDGSTCPPRCEGSPGAGFASPVRALPQRSAWLGAGECQGGSRTARGRRVRERAHSREPGWRDPRADPEGCNGPAAAYDD